MAMTLMKGLELKQELEADALKRAISYGEEHGFSSEYVEAVMAFSIHMSDMKHSEKLEKAKQKAGAGLVEAALVQGQLEDSVEKGFYHEHLLQIFKSHLSYFNKVQSGLVDLDAQFSSYGGDQLVSNLQKIVKADSCESKQIALEKKIINQKIDGKLLWAERSASKSKAGKRGNLIDQMIDREEHEHFSYEELKVEAQDQALSALWLEHDLAFEMGSDQSDELLADSAAAADFKIADLDQFIDALADLIELEKVEA